LLGFWKRAKAGREPARRASETSPVPQSRVFSSELKSKRVVVRGVVAGKPVVKTKFYAHPLFLGGGHEHVVEFALDGGVRVTFAGVACLKEGDEVEVAGVVLKPGELLAERVSTKEADFEAKF